MVKRAQIYLIAQSTLKPKSGYMEEVRFIELQKNKLLVHQTSKIVLKHENLQRFRSRTYTGPKKKWYLNESIMDTAPWVPTGRLGGTLFVYRIGQVS